MARHHVTVRVLPDPDGAAREAAQAVAAEARTAIERTGRFTVALAGGSTPERLYRLLAGGSGDLAVDWSSVHVFWGDERCVPPDHPDSNFGMARDALLRHVPVPPGHVHRIPGEMGAGEAARSACEELAAFFGTGRPGRLAARGEHGIDLALLGVGTDGHTASLFPGSPSVESQEWAVPAVAPEGAPSRQRVSLTLPALCASSRALFLVTGEGKAEIMRRLMTREGEALPAARVRPLRDTAWFLDEAAAARVGREEEA